MKRRELQGSWQAIGQWLRIGEITQWYEAFVLLNILDLLLTLYIIHWKHGIESNPFACFLLDTLGWSGFVLVKFAQCALVLLIAEFLYKRRHAAAWGIMGLACGSYWILMLHDSRLITLGV